MLNDMGIRPNLPQTAGLSYDPRIGEEKLGKPMAGRAISPCQMGRNGSRPAATLSKHGYWLIKHGPRTTWTALTFNGDLPC